MRTQRSARSAGAPRPVRSSTRRGFILLTAMVMFTSLLTLTSVMLGRSMTELFTANRSIDLHQAFQLAEAQVDDVLATLSQDPSIIFTGACPPAAYPAQTSCTLADITPNASAEQTTRTIRVIVTAGIPDLAASRARQTIEVVAEVEGASIFQWPVFGDSVLFGFGNNLVDGYDSTAGSYPYAGKPDAFARPTDAAVIRSNNRIFIQQLNSFTDTYFWSDVVVGPGRNPLTDILYNPASGQPNTHIGGQQGSGYAKILLPPVLIPAGTPTGSPYIRGDCDSEDPTVVFTIGGMEFPSLISVGANCKILLDGDGLARFDELTLGSGSRLRFDGHITVTTNKTNFQGVSSLEVKKGSVLMYVNGSSSNAVSVNVVNKTKDPTKFILYIKGSQGVDVLQTPFYGAIYAPDTSIWVHTGSKIYGSLIAGPYIMVDGMSDVHYDRALRGTKVNPTGRSRLLSWRQL